MKKQVRASKSDAQIGASLIVLSSFFYASYGIWTRLSEGYFTGYAATTVRSLLVLTILVPIAFKLKKLQKVKLTKNIPLLLGLIISSCFIWGPLYYAILNAGIGISIATNYAAIVIGMFFFGWLFFRERFTKVMGLSTLLGATGLAMIFVKGGSSFGLLAIAAAVLSGFATSLNMIISKKLSYNATQSTIILWSTGVIANAVMTVVAGETLPMPSWNINWLYLLLFSIASVAASWSFVSGLKLINAGVAGILGLLEVVFGIVFGVILFSERPGVWGYTGALVILVSAAIPYTNGLKALTQRKPKNI